MSHVAFPRRVDARGRTAAASDDDWIRVLIEQVLFTAPGERVNRPTFGSGLRQLLFAPNDPALAAAAQITAQGALQTWVGDLIDVVGLTVTADEARLDVAVTYTVRRTGLTATATFERAL